MISTESCACGQALHYNDPRVQKLVELVIGDLGPTVRIDVLGDGAYEVQRHYIALHGVKAEELPALARRGIVRRVQ